MKTYKWRRKTGPRKTNKVFLFFSQTWLTLHKWKLTNNTSKKSMTGLICKEAFIYDVRCFLGTLDLPTYPHQMPYYISLFSKIRHFSVKIMSEHKHAKLCNQVPSRWRTLTLLKISDRLGVLTFQTSDNSQLLRRVLWINA